MLERILTIATIVGLFLGGFAYINEHYASAADLKKLAQDFKLQSYDLRKRQLDDRIFELEFKRNATGRLSPLEQAQLDKFKREMSEIVGNEKATREAGER